MEISQNNNLLKIERKSEVLKRVGLSNTTLHRRIKQGTFPPSINLGAAGAKAVGFMSHEIDAFIIACALDEDPKRLVASLLEQRKQLMQNVHLLQHLARQR